MSEARNANERPDISATDVVTYLQDNPGFFNQHSEILLDIEIPHVNGGAVSLFDRQLTTLREENRRLKHTLNDLIKNARSNEALIRKIHELALLLMEATGPRAIFATLDEQLCEHFRADRSRVLVFGRASIADSDCAAEFVGGTDPRSATFKNVLNSTMPWCGEATDVYLSSLWPEHTLMGSLAVLPLQGGHWQGVLAIQSDDTTRFESGMGTDLLRYISDIVSLIIDPWVASTAAP